MVMVTASGISKGDRPTLDPTEGVAEKHRRVLSIRGIAPDFAPHAAARARAELARRSTGARKAGAAFIVAILEPRSTGPAFLDQPAKCKLRRLAGQLYGKNTVCTSCAQCALWTNSRAWTVLCAYVI